MNKTASDFSLVERIMESSKREDKVLKIENSAHRIEKLYRNKRQKQNQSIVNIQNLLGIRNSKYPRNP